MKTTLKNAAIATTVILALSACQGKKEEKAPAGGLVVTVDDAKGGKGGVTVTKDEKAVKDGKGLADAGEQLVGPYTFMLADRVFDSALQIDPNNKKAQFYKSFLKRMMVFKGVLNRVRPISQERNTSAQLEANISSIPESPAKEFLLDGLQDIRTVSDVQDLVAQYQQALNDFRKFAKANMDTELTLNLNPHIFEKEIREQADESCVVTPIENGSVKVVCDYTKAAQKKINAADMLSLAQITSGEMVLWAMYNSYDLSTLEKIGSDETTKAQSPQQQLETLKSYSSIAKLRADQTLSLIPELGADFSAAIKWAFEYQSRLCPRGNNKVNRRGFLFSKGICMTKTSETDRSLALLDQALKGVVRMPVRDDAGIQVSTVNVNFVQFLTHPPEDLRSVLPSEINETGRVTRQGADKTLGGLFPDGDAEILSTK